MGEEEDEEADEEEDERKAPSTCWAALSLIKAPGFLHFFLISFGGWLADSRSLTLISSRYCGDAPAFWLARAFPSPSGKKGTKKVEDVPGKTTSDAASALSLCPMLAC